ncbi:long-chain fatty acid--CoA ligase, partial [bacterium]|nr:long-chain fatty acid--CoA ligase [bacterium]
SRYVDNICVVGDEQKYLGALIIPEVSELKIFAKEQGIAYKNEDELLKDSAVLLLFKQLISEANKTFEPYEVVKEFKLLSIPCSVENGELTPTMKVRRRIVAERYKDIIDSLF